MPSRYFFKLKGEPDSELVSFDDDFSTHMGSGIVTHVPILEGPDTGFSELPDGARRPLSRYLSYLWDTFDGRSKFFDVTMVALIYELGSPTIRQDFMVRVKLVSTPAAYCKRIPMSRAADALLGVERKPEDR